MCVTALAPAVSGCQRYRPGCPCSRGGLLASVPRHVRPFRSFWPGWSVRFVRCGPFDFVAPFASFSSPCSLESAVAQVWRTRRGDRPDTATDHVARGHEDAGQTWMLVLSGRGNLPGLNIRLEHAFLRRQERPVMASSCVHAGSVKLAAKRSRSFGCPGAWSSGYSRADM